MCKKEKFSVPECVYIAEINIQKLFGCEKKTIKFRPLPKFPVVDRDLAVTVDAEVAVGDMIAEIYAAAGEMCCDVRLFDVYRGSQIPQGKKSVAYSLVLRAADRTLTVEECDRMMNNIFSGLESIGCEIRK